MSLSENIRLVRKKWGENQDEFSRRFGMTRSNLSRIESGEFELSVANSVLLSKLTGISINRLFEEVLEEGEIPPVPVGEGGEKFVGPSRVERVVVSSDLGEFADLRKVVGELISLRHDVDLLKGSIAVLDDEGQEKLKVFKALQVVIGYVEKDIDESEYQEEKKAYLDKLAGILSRLDEK